MNQSVAIIADFDDVQMPIAASMLNLNDVVIDQHSRFSTSPAMPENGFVGSALVSGTAH
jgi:hypothetical protein